jgi:murein DD-endopeptidase MepM/ murein hydrolase activator NlpD
MLRGGFAQMDRGGNFLVAAADGEVVEVKDHLYDRCHGSVVASDGNVGTIDCDGQIPRNADGTFEANLIRIRHADGLETSYIHIQRGSALVRRGETVTCGTRIASIGSSGSSIGPHLHFEVRRDGQVVDPYAGPLSQPESLWVAQGPDGNEIPAAQCR